MNQAGSLRKAWREGKGRTEEGVEGRTLWVCVEMVRFALKDGDNL